MMGGLGGAARRLSRVRHDEQLKQYTYGTHRALPPSETLQRVLPHLPTLGITRVANVTGLDDVGIPTAQAIRPNSRSLSVSQGKGLDLDAAKVSAIMESAEAFHAERGDLALRLASYEQLQGRAPVADVARLPGYVRPFDPRAPILWVEAAELESAAPSLVPYDLVHLNLSHPLVSATGFFPLGSNGLASGNSAAEASAHALCELVERDAVALFYRRPAAEQSLRRLQLASVDDAAARALLDRFAAAGVAVAVWDATSDVGVACFLCIIVERDLDPLRRVGKAMGFGCHPERGVALCRALTEAAQSRLTRITGSRDDILRTDFERLRAEPTIRRHQRELACYGSERRSFAEVPTLMLPSAQEDARWLCRRLVDVGCGAALVVDLSLPDLPFSVVRAIVPGLEGASDLPGYRPGARALAVAAEGSA